MIIYLLSYCNGLLVKLMTANMITFTLISILINLVIVLGAKIRTSVFNPTIWKGKADDKPATTYSFGIPDAYFYHAKCVSSNSIEHRIKNIKIATQFDVQTLIFRIHLLKKLSYICIYTFVGTTSLIRHSYWSCSKSFLRNDMILWKFKSLIMINR